MSLKKMIKDLTQAEKQELLEMLSATNDDVIESPAVKSDFTMDKERFTSDRRREPVKARENTFVDNGTDHKDIVTPEIERTPRNRKPPAKKQVVCRSCGKTFKVNARLVYGESYRCDRCTG